MKKFKRIASLVLTFGIAISSVSAYEFTEIRTEPTEKTMVLEAEDFVRGGGFSIVDDPEASGGKCVVGSGDQTTSIEFDIEFENPADVLVIYGTHKAEQKNGNLSYIAINHFENYSFYDYEIGKWNDTRIYYGSAPEGKYTIKLTSVRAGQKIDKLTIKYDEGEKKVLSPAAIKESQAYVPGKPEVESLNIAEVEERTPGSFFFDVENGNNSEKSIIGEDEEAFGGKYWYIPHDKGYTHLTDVFMTDEIFARFKFKVSRKGNYTLWVRYSTPEAKRKTTWFGIDNENYYRLEDKQVRGWMWKNNTTPFYLDEGWHTLDIKYRQPGQFIDCVILTDVNGFKVTGKGSLPGELLAYGAKELADIEEVNNTDKFKINNMRTKADCGFTHQNGDILVPATNLFNMMACDLEVFDDYCIATQGRTHLKFYKDSSRVIANGEEIDIGVKAFFYDGAIPMVSIKAVKKAFGIDYEYDEQQSCLNVFYDFEEPEYRQAKEGEIEVTPGQWSFKYRIPCNDPNAKVRVWHRCDIGESAIHSRMDYDNMNNLSEHRIALLKAAASSQQWDYWIEAPPPTYVDGAFVGADTTPQHGTQDFKVQIISNGVTDTFIKTNGVKTINSNGLDRNLTPEEYAPNTGGELYVVPTFESIGYYIDVPGETTGCTVYYRKKGDSEWRKAYAPTYDSGSLQYRGSIVYCSEDTEYELKAELTGPGAGEKYAETRTWTQNVPIGKTIGLSEIYSGEGPLSLIDLKGTADSWIKIVPDEKCDTINGTKNFYQALMLYDCEYVILEGLKVRGGRTNCVNIQGDCKDIRIINCDIAHWGNEGIQDPNTGAFFWRGIKANYYAGIYLCEATNAVIERCYIHDSDTRSNAWYGETYSNIHPAGSTAICLNALKGTVIRYNDLIGSDKHRYNDVMEGRNNNGRDWSSTGSDSDIYGNMMAFSQDDGIELDGGQMNVRFFKNRIENTYVGISTAPNRMGPSYLFNNLLINLGSSYQHQAGTGLKAGGGYEGGIIGMLHFFNNSVHTAGAPLANINYSGSREYHAITRNNVFIKDGTSGHVIANTFANELDDNDYDLMAGGAGTFDMKEGDESHAVLAMPVYENYEEGDVHMTAESPGVGAGVYIDNFAEYENPNMGVYPSSDYDKMHMPYRPIDMYVDTPIKQVLDLEEREITVHVGDIGEGHTYSIIKNDDYKWLEITSEAGMKDVPLKPNTDITFKIKGDLSKSEFEVGRATILFRLENGFSVPISVNCTAPVVVVEEE